MHFNLGHGVAILIVAFDHAPIIASLFPINGIHFRFSTAEWAGAQDRAIVVKSFF
jgi:hypothetical protein